MVNEKVIIHVCEPSPYNGKSGVVVGRKDNIDKHGAKSAIFLVRLDKPHRAGFETVGFPFEALEKVGGGKKEMKLTDEDKKLLLDWGYTERDFPQIEEAFQASKTKYKLGSIPISRDEAVRVLGRRQYLSGIARSAFHFSAAREVPMSTSGEVVYFDSSRLFK